MRPGTGRDYEMGPYPGMDPGYMYPGMQPGMQPGMFPGMQQYYTPQIQYMIYEMYRMNCEIYQMMQEMQAANQEE